MLTYQFNEQRREEVRQFFEHVVGVGLKDYTYLPQPPANGVGRLMQATIEVDNLATLIRNIEQIGKMREWNNLHGDIVV